MEKEEFREYLIEIQNFLNRISNNGKIKLSEPDTRVKISEKLLYLLGYKEEYMLRESTEGNSRNRTDAHIEFSSNSSFYNRNKIVIEYKKYNLKLDKKLVSNFINKYLVDKKPTWAILTNGNEYRLYGKPFNIYDDEIEIYRVYIDIEHIDTSNDEVFDKMYNQMNLLSKEVLFESIYGEALNALSKYISYYKDKSNAENMVANVRTYKDEIILFINFIKNCYPDVKFSQMNEYFIEKFIEYRCDLSQKKGKINKPARLNVSMIAVISFLKFCHENNLMGYKYPGIYNINVKNTIHNKLVEIRGENDINFKRKMTNPFKVDELNWILNSLWKILNNELLKEKRDIERVYISYRDYIIVILALYYGFKKGEILNLKKKDICINEHTIITSKKVVKMKSKILLEDVNTFLKIHKDYCKYANPKHGKEFLFLTDIKHHKTDGVKNLTANNLNEILKKIFKNAGILKERAKELSFESFSVTTFILAINNPKSFLVASDLVGKDMKIPQLRNLFICFNNLNNEDIEEMIYDNHPMNKIVENVKMKEGSRI